jgi:protein-disulfide isomerase
LLSYYFKEESGYHRRGPNTDSRGPDVFGTKNKTLDLYAVVVLTVATLAGCATLQTSQTESTEQLLSAAGFHLKLANTPERQAHLQTLVQGQVVPYERKGKTIYVYADAAKDRLYVGDEAAYQRFQQLAVRKADRP